MVKAYIMVKANTGEADRLQGEIRECDGVDQVYIVAGDVDLIVKASVDSPADVKGLVADCIHSINGVADTSTYIAMV